MSATPQAAPVPSRNSRRKLWDVLAVLDAFLVLALGIALGVKIFRQGFAPAAPAAETRPTPAPKPSEPAKPAEPVQTQAVVAVKPAPKPAKPPRPFLAKAAPPQEAAEHLVAEANSPPRNPRLIVEWLKSRAATAQAGENSEPVGGAQPRNRRLVIEWRKSQEAAQEAAKKREQPLERRHSVQVEFKLKAARGRSVQLAGAFLVSGGRRKMVRQDEGMWTLSLNLLPGVSYRYWFIVDGKKILDPANFTVERGASVLVLP